MAETIRVSLALFVIAAAVIDVWRRRIPNWLILTGLAAALGFAAAEVFASGRLVPVARCFGGLLLGLAVYVPLYALRAVGAGDAKLMAVIGAFAGARAWLVIFLLSALAGGAVAVVVVLVRGRVAETLRNVARILGELAHLRSPSRKYPDLDVRSENAVRLPHGFSIAVGTLLYLAANGFGIL